MKKTILNEKTIGRNPIKIKREQKPIKKIETMKTNRKRKQYQDQLENGNENPI